MRLTRTPDQAAAMLGLLDIATTKLGEAIAQHGLRGVDDGIRKLAAAAELRDAIEQAMQPKPRAPRAPKPPEE